MVDKIRDLWPKYEGRQGFSHKYVANTPIEDIVSIVRRWAAKTRAKHGDDAKLLIVYDYLKLTGEKVSESWKEYQVMGKKADTLKHLCSEVGAAGLAAVQTNASGDVAMAQQIKWFCSNLYILRPKTPEEINEHGPDFGTHNMYAAATRNQGEDAQGFLNFVPIRQANGSVRYEPNFICLHFDHFNVVEKGTYQDVIERSPDDAADFADEEAGTDELL